MCNVQCELPPRGQLCYAGACEKTLVLIATNRIGLTRVCLVLQHEIDMVPLMMQVDYKPTGWLGLILGCAQTAAQHRHRSLCLVVESFSSSSQGALRDCCRTKLYYKFFAAAVDTEQKFTQQMDALTREIGDRGKTTTVSAARRVSEGVPPFSLALEPAPAPAPASVPAPAPAPTPSLLASTTSSTASALEQTFSPSVSLPRPAAITQQPTIPSLSSDSSSSNSSSSAAITVELVRLMTEREDKQRKEMEAMIQAQRDEAKAERSEMEAKIEALKEELAPAPAVSEEQLTSLQARFEGLHATKLLADEVRVHSLVHA